MKGTINGISGHTFLVTTTELVSYPIGTVIDFELHKEKRSLNANSYFHVLVGKLAEALKQSKSYVKNMLVANYGQVYIFDDKIATYTTTIPPEIILNQEEPHLWHIYTKVIDEDTWFTYRVYRNTRDYNTKEFSILLEGTIEECRQLDIETLTPDELLRLEGYEKQGYKLHG